MKKLFKSILGIIVMFVVVLFITALTTPQTLEYESELSFAGEASASFYAVQSPPTNLYSGISSSANSARLRSFNDLGGDELTMSMFGDIGYVTFEPGILGKEEVASFTGITDNGDGTQTITGLTRGLYGRYPFGAGGSASSHGSNTYVVVSNPGDFYNHFAIKENDESITGTWTYSSTSQPVYDGSPTFTDTNSLISKGYADGLVAAGVATSSETTFGGAKLATQLEMASSSYSVTDPKVLYSRYSTSSPDGTPAAYYALILNAAGKIAQSALDLTVSWAFTDDVSVTGTTTLATTTVTDLTIDGNAYTPIIGGTGADGALAITIGATDIDLGSARIVIKNYTSISITGTGKVTFSNPHVNGSIVIFKSQGDVILTSSETPIIDLEGIGATGGAVKTGTNADGNVGTDGNGKIYLTNKGAQGTTSAGGAGGAIVSASSIFVNSEYVKYNELFVGAGAGSGSIASGGAPVTSGAGGRGGGALVIECGGAWNFTTTNGISVAGADGGNGSTPSANTGAGGGGGGGGGLLLVLYTSLTANTGTVSVSGGTGGDYHENVTAGTAYGGGGGGGYTAGSTGTNGNSTDGTKTGGDGGDGLSIIQAI